MFYKKNTSNSTPDSKDKTEEELLDQWLTYLYRESWQQELLLIGITLFLLFQVPTGINYLLVKIDQIFYRTDLIVSGTLILLHAFRASSYILILNIIADLFLRGVWIGLIGLNSAFPDGVKEEKFRYHASIRKTIFRRLVSAKTSIIKLDKVCSIIFSFTFLIIFYLISLALFIFFLLLIVLGIQFFDGSWLFGVFILFAILYTLSAFLYFLDFITLGGLRRFKWTAIPFKFIYIFFSYITLSFFYRNIYYTLISNVKKRYLIPVLAVYLVLSVTLLESVETKINRGSMDRMSQVFYDNQRKEGQHIELAAIPSDQVKSNWLQVFVNFNLSRQVIQHFCPKHEDEDWEVLNTRPKVNKKTLLCLQNSYKLRIDKVVTDSVSWLYYEHPNMDEAGFITKVPVKDLTSGLHSLQVLQPKFNKKDSLIYTVSCTIPFWKE